MQLLFIFIIFSTLSGCAPHSYEADRLAQYRASVKPTIFQRKSTFDISEYANFQASGSAKLSGEAFLKTRGGDVRYGAGSQILLIPATAYAREFVEQDLVRMKKEIEPPLDHRLYDIIRSTQADSKGKFIFSNIPGGTYILYTSITWEVPQFSRTLGSYSSSTGGPVWQEITVQDGEQRLIILTR